MQTSRRLPFSPATPPTKRPLELISDDVHTHKIAHSKRVKLPINNMSHDDIVSTQASKNWRIGSLDVVFTNAADAKRFQRQSRADTPHAFYFTKIDAHWFNEQARGRYFPPAIHSAPSSRNIADKLAQRLRRLWFTRKLNRIAACVEPLPIPLTELDPVHNIHRFVNHALDRVRSYVNVDEEEEQFRIDFARQAIFDPPGVWITVPRLLEARRAAALVDVDIYDI